MAKVIAYRVGEPAQVIDLADLKAMQAFVGGWVERARLEGETGSRAGVVDLFFNEEGAIMNPPLPPNVLHPDLGPILGNAFVTRADSEGETVDVTAEDIEGWSTLPRFVLRTAAAMEEVG